MKYRFTAAEHEEFGMLGLCPDWMRDADPLTGMAVAHDILEHFPSEPDPVSGELEALGASLYIRGLGNYWSMKGNLHQPDVHISPDIADILWRTRSGDQDLPIVAKVAPWRGREEVRHWITGAIGHLKAELRARKQPPLTPEESKAIEHYLKTGFKRCSDRYRDTAPFGLASFFMEIERKADEILKHAEAGMKFEFEVRFKNLSVNVKEIYDE